mgnify:CR=1 FL=1
MEIPHVVPFFFAYARESALQPVCMPSVRSDIRRRITGKRVPVGDQGSAGKEVNWKRGAFAN